MDEPTFSIGENSLQFSQPAIALPIGYAAIAGHYFRHPPRPTPYESSWRSPPLKTASRQPRRCTA